MHIKQAIVKLQKSIGRMMPKGGKHVLRRLLKMPVLVILRLYGSELLSVRCTFQSFVRMT